MTKEKVLMLMKRISILMTLLSLLVNVFPVHTLSAQDDIQITAEVIYPEVHIRIGPARKYDSLGLLHNGDIVIVEARETLFRADKDHWAYVIVPESGLQGWIRQDLFPL
jgi:hypothetical protein